MRDQFKLKELRIRRLSSYQDETEPLEAAVKFDGQYGSTELRLNERLSQKILELCADEIAASAAEIADNLKADARAITASLPAPTTQPAEK